MRDLRASGEPQFSGAAWLIEIEARIGGTGTADMLFGKEAVGTAADDFRDGLERGLARNPLRHDGRNSRTRSRQRLGQVRKRALEAEPNGPVLGGRQFIGRGD